MKYIKYLALLIVIFFILNCFSSSAVSDSDDETSRRYNFLDKFRLAFFRSTKDLKGLFPWAAMRFQEPRLFVADPSELNLTFSDKIEVNIGIKNETTGDWINLDEVTIGVLFPSQDFQFDLEVPSDLPEEYFSYNFQPSSLAVTLDGENEGKVKTTLIINANIPQDAVIPKTLIFRVNVSTYVTGIFMYLPPPPSKTPNENDNIISWLISAPTWFLSSISPSNPFGKIYSGKRVYDYPSTYIDIIVKVDRYHLAKIESPPKQIKMGSDDITTVPIEIHNRGTHLDTFNFLASTNKGSNLIISPPPAITLGPNEKAEAIVTIASPPNFDDPGTLHSINIKAYSVYDPDKEIFDNTITVYTKGMHLSEINVVYFGFLIILIAFIYIYLRHKRRLIYNQICKKPDKPWDLAEEKKYLEELKTKNKKKYEEVLQMMSQEYKSSLLWYQNYCNVILLNRKEKLKKLREKEKIKKIELTQTEQKQEIKEKTIKESKPKKIEKPEIKKETKVKEPKPEPKKEKEIKEKPEIDKKAEEEKRKKEKALNRIKREQEKQKRKFS